MIDFSLDLKVIIAILALSATITIALYFQWWRNRKKLSYEVTTKTQLLTASEEIKNELQVIYKGEPVTNVILLVIKVINDGYQPIKKDDFEKKLSFLFPKETKFLSTEVINVNPENLDIQTSLSENKISFEPILLNSRDSFEIALLISSEKSHFKTDARIVGVKAVENRNGYNPVKAKIQLLFGFVLIGLGLSLASFGFPTAPENQGYRAIGFSIAITTVAFLLPNVLDYIKYHRKIRSGKENF